MKVVASPTVEPITLASLREHCRLDPDDPATLLPTYLGAAREWVEAFLGFAVAPTTVQSVYAMFPTGSIPLEAAPVLSVTSIVYANSAGADTTLATSVYGLDALAGAVTPTTIWPTGGTNVRVRYVIGYSPESDTTQIAPLPWSIRAAILLLAEILNEQRADEPTEEVRTRTSALLSPYRTRLGFA